MKLRGYQSRAVRVLPGLLVAKRRVVLVGPTGSGKTVVATHTLLELRGKRVLWVAHRWELLDQARNQLIAAGIPESEIRMFTGTEKKGDEDAWITVASIDMFHLHDAPPFDVLVIDEAHRALAASYLKLLAKRPKAMALGLTATPRRLDGKPLGDVFVHMHVMAEVTDLIATGHIAAPRTYGVPLEKARAMVRGLKMGHGDYQQGQLARAMTRKKLMGDVVSECARLAPGVPTLVFSVNCDHGKALAARFKASGRPTGYIDWETPHGERARILAALATGEVEVVVSPNCLSEGLDCPPLKCIALCRPTKSITLFLQQVGRASRPWRGKRAMVLDHAGNCWRFGLPQAGRSWSLNADKELKIGQQPLRHCAECGALNAIGAANCAECGSAFQPTEREISEERARLERLKASRAEISETRARLRVVAREIGANETWCTRALGKIYGNTVST